jgi:hypothetical protein
MSQKLLLLQLPSADRLQQLPKLKNNNPDAAAATEFCKSTVATTEIKPQLIQQRVRERKQQLTSANQQLHH